MSGVIELDPSFITAEPISSGTFPDFSPEPQPPLHAIDMFIQQNGIEYYMANGKNIFKPEVLQNQAEVTKAVFVGWNDLSAIDLQKQLEMHAFIQKRAVDERVNSGSPLLLEGIMILSTGPDYSRLVYGETEFKVSQSDNPDFYGTPLMFAAGVYYWVYGGGKTRRVRIESLNLQMVPGDFKELMNAVAANGPGTYQIAAADSYNTFGPAYLTAFSGLLLGRVAFDYSGTLVINTDNSWAFDGAYTIRPDVFDADPSKRAWLQEVLTTGLRKIGEVMGHTDYTIEVIGSKAVKFSGTK